MPRRSKDEHSAQIATCDAVGSQRANMERGLIGEDLGTLVRMPIVGALMLFFCRLLARPGS